MFGLLCNKYQNWYETFVLESTKWNSCNNKKILQAESIHDVNMEITVTTWRLIYETTIVVSAQTPVTRPFVQQFILVNFNENMKPCVAGHLLRDSSGRIPLTKGQ